MRSSPASFRLTFLLPAELRFSRRVRPCSSHATHGCERRFDSTGFIAIIGGSKEAVFEDAAALLRDLSDGIPRSIAGVLSSPPPASGRDGWSIIVGADVAFSPTSLPPHFSTLEHEPLPAIAGGG